MSLPPPTYFSPGLSSEEQIQAFYLAVYGRAADPEGLDFWLDYKENESNFISFLLAFTDSDEFTVRWGESSTEAIVQNVYQQMFGRDPVGDELQDGISLVDVGYWGFSNLVYLDLDRAIEGDQGTVLNRIEVAQAVTAEIRNLQNTSDVFYDISNDIDDASDMTNYFAQITANTGVPTDDLLDSSIDILMMDLGYIL